VCDRAPARPQLGPATRITLQWRALADLQLKGMANRSTPHCSPLRALVQQAAVVESYKQTVPELVNWVLRNINGSEYGLEERRPYTDYAGHAQTDATTRMVSELRLWVPAALRATFSHKLHLLVCLAVCVSALLRSVCIRHPPQ
jgi:hypothetical protein